MAFILVDGELITIEEALKRLIDKEEEKRRSSFDEFNEQIR